MNDTDKGIPQANHPAFPCEAQPDRGVPPEHDYIQTGIYSGKFPGLSMRDWFAGQALVGIMSDPGMRPGNLDEFSCMAMRLYQVADAMLVHRALAKVTPE